MKKTNFKEAREVYQGIIDKLNNVINVTPDEGRVCKLWGGEIKESYKNLRSAATCNAVTEGEIKKAIKYGTALKRHFWIMNTDETDSEV